MAQKGQLAVIKEFFGYNSYWPVDPAKASMSPEQFKELSYDEQVRAGGLKGFSAEIKALTPEEKLWLTSRAAKEIGYTAEAVDFPLE